MSPARTFVGYQLERSTLARLALDFLPQPEGGVASRRATATAPEMSAETIAAARIQAQRRGKTGRALSVERRAMHLRLQERLLDQRRAQSQRDKACLDAGLRTDSVVLQARSSCEGAFRAVLEHDNDLQELDETDSHLLGGTGFGDTAQAAAQPSGPSAAASDHTRAACARAAGPAVALEPAETAPPAELSEAASRVLALIDGPMHDLAPAAAGASAPPDGSGERDDAPDPLLLEAAPAAHAAAPSAAVTAPFEPEAACSEGAAGPVEPGTAPPEPAATPSARAAAPAESDAVSERDAPPSTLAEPPAPPPPAAPPLAPIAFAARAHAGATDAERPPEASLSASLSTIGEELEYGLGPILERMGSSAPSNAPVTGAGDVADDLVRTLIRWIKARDEAAAAAELGGRPAAPSELTSAAARELLGQVTPASSAVWPGGASHTAQHPPASPSPQGAPTPPAPPGPMASLPPPPLASERTRDAISRPSTATDGSAVEPARAETGAGSGEPAEPSPPQPEVAPSAAAVELPAARAPTDVCAPATETSTGHPVRGGPGENVPAGAEVGSRAASELGAAPAPAIAEAVVLDAPSGTAAPAAPVGASTEQMASLLSQTRAAIDSLGYRGEAAAGRGGTGDDGEAAGLEGLLRSADLTDLLSRLGGAQRDGGTAAMLYEAVYVPPAGARPLGAPRQPWAYSGSDAGTELPERMRELELAMRPFSGGGSPWRAPSGGTSSGVRGDPFAVESGLTPSEEWLERNRDYLSAVRRAAADVQRDDPTSRLPVEPAQPLAPGLMLSAGISSHPSAEELHLQLRRLADGVAESVRKVTSRLDPHPSRSDPHPSRSDAYPGRPDAYPSRRDPFPDPQPSNLHPRRYSALGPFPPSPPRQARPHLGSAAAAAAARLAAMPLPPPPPVPSPAPLWPPAGWPPGSSATAPSEAYQRAPPPPSYPAAAPAPAAPHPGHGLHLEPQMPPLPPLPPLGFAYGRQGGPGASPDYPGPMWAPRERDGPALPPPSGGPSVADAWRGQPSASAPVASPMEYRMEMDGFRSRIEAQRVPAWQPYTHDARTVLAAVEQSRWRAAAARPAERRAQWGGSGAGGSGTAAVLSSYDRRVRELAAGLMAAAP